MAAQPGGLGRQSSLGTAPHQAAPRTGASREPRFDRRTTAGARCRVGWHFSAQSSANFAPQHSSPRPHSGQSEMSSATAPADHWRSWIPIRPPAARPLARPRDRPHAVEKAWCRCSQLHPQWRAPEWKAEQRARPWQHSRAGVAAAPVG
eukprot:5599207-Prymnesium_polylepis.2